MRYYVEQFDCFWSLSRAEIEALLAMGSQTGGHDLEGFRELRGRPAGVRRDRGERDYYTVSNDVFLIGPLDFEKEDYREALEKLKEHY